MAESKEILLETSVIIHHVFDEKRFHERVEGMFSELSLAHVPWKVSSLVRIQAYELVDRLGLFLSATIKALLDEIRERHRAGGLPVDEFVPTDLDLVREFFLKRIDTGSEPQKVRMDYLETFIISGLQAAQRKGGTSAKKHFGWLLTELRTMTVNIKLRLDTLILDEVGDGRDEPEVEKLKIKLGAMKESDLFILAEVVLYARKSSLKCFLASVDYTDFIKNKALVESETGVVCCDPLYLISSYKAG